MARPRSGFHGEADFDGHLPVMHQVPTRTYRLRHFFKQQLGSSFTKHLSYKEDDDGSEKAPAPEKPYQGVTNGGKHGLYYQCNHLVLSRFYLFCPATVSRRLQGDCC